MKRLSLGTWFGVPVYVQPAFFIFYGVFHAVAALTLPWNTVLINMAKLLSLFVFILPHEFGHVLAGRAFGLQTREVIISFYGAGALMPGLKDAKPRSEIVVALAGPLVTLGLAGVSLVALALSPAWLRPALQWSFAANVVLFYFNMLPVFPLDGGRVLRGLACLAASRTTGTRFAIVVSFVLTALLWAGVFLAGALLMAAIIVTIIALPTGIYEWNRVGETNDDNVYLF